VAGHSARLVDDQKSIHITNLRQIGRGCSDTRAEGADAPRVFSGAQAAQATGLANSEQNRIKS